MYVDLVRTVEKKYTAVGNQFYFSLFAAMHIFGGYHSHACTGRTQPRGTRSWNRGCYISVAFQQRLHQAINEMVYTPNQSDCLHGVGHSALVLLG